MRIILARVGLSLLLVYVCVLAYGVFLSNHLLFCPPAATYSDTKEVLKLTAADGARISAIYLPNPEATHTLLFSHGNAEDLGIIRPQMEAFARMGFSVFAYDYHGYGTSEGKPSERNAYRDVDAAYDFMTQRLGIPADRIIAYGRSLGGALAVDLACRRPVAGLVMESAFVTAFRVKTRVPLFPFDKFRCIDKIKRVHCPVLVIHGTKDTTVAFWHGEELFHAANEPKLRLWVDGAGHDDLAEVAGSTYGEAFAGLLALVEGEQANE